jgi:hypothetical protein
MGRTPHRAGHGFCAKFPLQKDVGSKSSEAQVFGFDKKHEVNFDKANS